MSIFKTFQPLCQTIWRDKYKFEEEVDQVATCSRVSRAVMGREHPEVFQLLADTGLVPGGRIIAGAGTGRAVTMINCYVMANIDDSLADIFRVLRESALTMQQGGGIGMDFSPLRPRGALVKKLGAEASGPLSFMDVWDSMCRTIMSAAYRRGAMMGTLRCTHPDVIDFIEAKKEKGRLTKFNVSVTVTDAFMEAVRLGKQWRLIHKEPPLGRDVSTLEHDGEAYYIYDTVPARDLWNKILETTYHYAEPGVIFIDRMNDRNNLRYCETIYTTNPCSEQPLPAYGDCCLGAINLTRFVVDPWTDHPEIDWDALDDATALGVEFLDNVLDVTNYPLEAQRIEAQAKRRIGLGVMGLANLFQMMGIRYGSNESVATTRNIFGYIKDSAYAASARLAGEKGRYPAWNDEAPSYIDKIGLSEYTRNKIYANGLRNGVILTVAPTGTTAIFAGNVSGGIEPVFAHRFIRNVLEKDGVTQREEFAYDWGFLEWCRSMEVDPDGRSALEELPAHFVIAEELSVEEHVRVMAAAQDYIDASISKTINCPEDMTFEEFKGVYDLAYSSGLKSCTTYRPSDVRGAVLVNKDAPAAPEGTPEPVPLQNEAETVHYKLPERPVKLPGVTYKLKPAEHAYYVTITQRDGHPCELFISSKEAGLSDWTAALGRMVSAIWRRGGDTSFVAEELQQIHSARGGFWHEGKYQVSLVAAIGDLIAQETGQEVKVIFDEPILEISDGNLINGESCPRCQHVGLTHKEGCATCLNCGWSNCG